MKYLLIITILFSGSLYAQRGPDFKKIFTQIESTNSVTEAISIRESYLPEMRSMNDFARLTDLEKLAAGESFFAHYKSMLADFISSNIGEFMNPNVKGEMMIFLNKVYPKVKGTKHDYAVAELGLSYVGNCEEFKLYVKKTNSALKEIYMREFCYW